MVETMEPFLAYAASQGLRAISMVVPSNEGIHELAHRGFTVVTLAKANPGLIFYCHDQRFIRTLDVWKTMQLNGGDVRSALSVLDEPLRYPTVKWYTSGRMYKMIIQPDRMVPFKIWLSKAMSGDKDVCCICFEERKEEQEQEHLASSARWRDLRSREAEVGGLACTRCADGWICGECMAKDRTMLVTPCPVCRVPRSGIRYRVSTT
jgi:hypothetical protein